MENNSGTTILIVLLLLIFGGALVWFFVLSERSEGTGLETQINTPADDDQDGLSL